MNRRQLFAALAAAAVAPEEIWTPSRSIFLPPRGGWAARGGYDAPVLAIVGLVAGAEFTVSAQDLIDWNVDVGDLVRMTYDGSTLESSVNGVVHRVQWINWIVQ